jgi:PadR family transcriptional regulator, regulatory protein PadR
MTDDSKWETAKIYIQVGAISPLLGLVLTAYVYICRVVSMTLARKCSPQTIDLLAALMEQPRTWQHGYKLSKDTGLLSGTLYPILMRLSDRGYLDHKWIQSPDTGVPPRHAYRLTAKGIAHAKEQTALYAEAGAKPSRSVSSV